MHIANRYWKIIVASPIDKTPNTHVRPRIGSNEQILRRPLLKKYNIFKLNMGVLIFSFYLMVGYNIR